MCDSTIMAECADHMIEVDIVDQFVGVRPSRSRSSEVRHTYWPASTVQYRTLRRVPERT